MLAGSHRRCSQAHTQLRRQIYFEMDNKDTHIRKQWSEVIKAERPELGFFWKSRTQTDGVDGKKHTKFHWRPVLVGAVWVSEQDKKCYINFELVNDGRYPVVNIQITRHQYNLFGSYVRDGRRIGLIQDILKKNRTGLCIRKQGQPCRINLKVSKLLFAELESNAKKCGQNLSQYCTCLLSGKHPRAALSESEAEGIRNLLKIRNDVQFQFNAMKTVFASLSPEERMRMLAGKDYEWWGKYMIAVLEIIYNLMEEQSNGY